MWLPVRQNVFHWAHGKPIKNSCDVKIHAAQECNQTFHLRFSTGKVISMEIAISGTRTHICAHTHTHLPDM